MSHPDELTPEQWAELQQMLQGNPVLARTELLTNLAKEHPEHIAVDIKLNPDPDARDPDRAPMKLTATWTVKGRGQAQLQQWDGYVRYELKKRLGLDEPTSLTEDQLGAAQLRDRQP